MFHNNLKAQRLRRGISQKQVADFLCVSAQSVSKWEKGDALPSIEYLPKLADCFNCDINAFFAKEEQELLNFGEIVAYFSLATEVRCETKELGDICALITEKPGIVDSVISVCKELMAYKTVNTGCVRGILGCDEVEARTFMGYLQQCELIVKLGIDDFYYVIQDTVEGYITLIKMQQMVCEMQKKIEEGSKNDTKGTVVNKEKTTAFPENSVGEP